MQVKLIHDNDWISWAIAHAPAFQLTAKALAYLRLDDLDCLPMSPLFPAT